MRLERNTPNILMKSSVSSTSSYSFDLSKALGKGVFKWLNDFGGSKIKNPLLKGVYQLGVNEVAKALGYADATNSQILNAVNQVLDEVKAMQNQLKSMLWRSTSSMKTGIAQKLNYLLKRKKAFM